MKRKSTKTSKEDMFTIKIAIVEDDETIRSGYEYFLSNEKGFKVCGSYGSYEAAIETIGIAEPDIILLDVQLPGKRGVDVIPDLKKILPDVLVLILTVYETEEIIFTALKNGAAGYLTKNISTDKLISGIREVMSGGAAMSSGIAKLVIQSFRRNPNSPLSKRETEILEGISEGKSRSKIASQFFIDLETVKTHIKNIYHKLDVNSKDEAIKVAKAGKYI